MYAIEVACWSEKILFSGSGALKVLVCCVGRGCIEDFCNPLVRVVVSVAVALKSAVIRLAVVACSGTILLGFFVLEKMSEIAVHCCLSHGTRVFAAWFYFSQGCGRNVVQGSAGREMFVFHEGLEGRS